MDSKLKDQICRAFCQDIQVAEVPAGLALSTAFVNSDGDNIGFYIVGPDANGLFRIEDDGTTVPFLQASGADIDNASRYAVFESLLNTYGAQYNEHTFEIQSPKMRESEIPSAALRFVNLIVRVQDILYLASERAASTFKEDVLREMHEQYKEAINIDVDAVVSQSLSEYPADIVLRAPPDHPKAQDPVAVYLCNADQKVLEAMLLHMASRFEKQVPCKVVALVENIKSVTSKNLARANNHLDAVTIFREDPSQSIKRIAQEIYGSSLH